MDIHGGRSVPESVMGKSIVPLLKEDGHHHGGLLFGYFGREVNMIDGVCTYHRMPTPNSTCDFHFTDLNKAAPSSVQKAELGPHLEYSNGIPHFRITRQSVLALS